MRISGGSARGIPLIVPKGDAVRPATDGMRQAVFSSLASLVPGANFIDLFAGSGAYGLEAISRGATAGTFIEQNAKAVACVRQNLQAVCKSVGIASGAFEIRTGDALAAPLTIANAAAPDLVFIDPPYELIEEITPPLFRRLAEVLRAKPDGLVVFEMPGELTLKPPGWHTVKRLGKGARQPTVAFFRLDSVST